MTSKIDEISKTDEDFFVTRITAKKGRDLLAIYLTIESIILIDIRKSYEII